MVEALFVLACLCVAGILIYGLRGWGTGSLTPMQQNKVMRWRIAAQFIAVVILMALFFLLEKP